MCRPMHRLLAVMLIFGAAPVTAHAQNLLQHGDAEDAAGVQRWQRARHVIEDAARQARVSGLVQRDTSDPHFGEAALAFGERDWIYAPELIEIDPTKTYELSGFFKTADGTEARTLFGLRQYTADKTHIDLLAAKVVPGTMTELAEDAKPGDETVTVNSTGWTAERLHAIAFDVKADRSDLPNNDSLPITDYEVTDGKTKLILRKPVKHDHAAGTPVRQHRYIDPESMQVEADGQWRRFSLTIGGQSPLGEPKDEQFWHNTRYVRVCLMPNFRRPNESDHVTFLFDDLTFTEVQPDQE